MRTHTDKNGNTEVTLDKTEQATLNRATSIAREMSRYPEKFPRAAAECEALANIDKAVPTK